MQGIFSGFAIIGGYIFLFYMPLGLALVIIYLCPVVGMLLTRLFPRKRFGKYMSAAIPALLLAACFAVLPLILFTIREHRSIETKSNETTHENETIHQNATNNDTNNESGETASIGWFYLGVGMALLISVSDASHKIIVGYLYGNKSTNSTILTTYYAGYGGIVVGLVAAIFDENQKLLSPHITSITPKYWGLLFGLALLKLVTFLIINSAVKYIRPLVIYVMKYRRKRTISAG